jgi:hypothetical protein
MAAACRDRDGIAWIGLYRPTHEEFADATREFALHELAGHSTPSCAGVGNPGCPRRMCDMRESQRLAAAGMSGRSSPR